MGIPEQPPPYSIEAQEQQGTSQSQPHQYNQPFQQPIPPQPIRPYPASQQPQQVPTSHLVGELARRTVAQAMAIGQQAVATASTVVQEINRPKVAPESYLIISVPPNSQPSQQYSQSYPQPYPPTQPYSQPYPPAQPYPQPYPPAQPSPPGIPPSIPQKESYWSILQSSQAWLLILFYIFFDFTWTLFCFVWCLTTLVLGVGLLPLFPLGYSILFVGSLSWRALAKSELFFISGFHPLIASEIQSVFLHGNDSVLDTMSRHVWNWSSWKCALYFIFYKLITGVLLFALSLVCIVFALVLFFIAPLFFRLLVWSSVQQSRVASRWLKIN
jgi:hypothetical protein